MKASEVTAEIMVDYLRLDEPSDIERKEITDMISIAKSHISDYTGLTLEEIDKHANITHALKLLVADMFDNRNLYIDGKASNMNKAVECILRMHSTNLL